VVFHAINRGNCRMPIFEKPADYLAFLRLLEEGRERVGVRLLAYCLMPNHWHLVLWPRRAQDLSDYFRWVCTTHVRRWRAHRRSGGEGHLYQGRFKSFPIQRDEHLLAVMRYVEANARRAGLVERAEDWPYGSLWSPPNLERLRTSVIRGRPYGGDRWTVTAAARLGLASTLRGPGRPRKQPRDTGSLAAINV
jgi:putative transposase